MPLRFLYATTLTLLVVLACRQLRADDNPAPDKAADSPAATEDDGGTLGERVQKSLDDTESFRALLTKHMSEIRTLIESDTDAAKVKVAELKTAVESLVVKEEGAASTNLRQAKSLVTFLERQVELATVTVDGLEKKLDANPDDNEAMGLYRNKISQEIAGKARSNPDEAANTLKQAIAFLDALSEKTESETTKIGIKGMQTRLASYESQIEAARRMQELIGKEAAPLAVTDWVNGDPLTDADLKGKVVLLDFWAVWCGPCIATFPHLREWQKEYSDKGLVIIGVTSKYGYEWDKEAGKATRGKDVSTEAELEMLKEFAKSHDLTHRFALQDGKDMSKYYGVNGIPQAVVIDREGKIALIKVGSGEENAKAIHETLEKLIAEK